MRSLVALTAFLALTTCGAAATFTAALDRDTISLGESASLSVTYSGTEQISAPTLRDIPNLRVSYVGPSQQVTIENGRVSATVTHQYSVTPTQVGNYTIPAISINVRGQAMATQPLSLKVVKPGTPSPNAAAAANQLAFLRLSLPKKECYVGEVMTAELQLHVRTGVQGIDRFQLTSFPSEGFNVGKMVQGQQRPAPGANNAYTIIPLAFTVTPVKAGKLNLGPVTASVVVQVPSRSRSRDPFFDPFGMFGGAEQKQVVMATEPETLEVLPLPKQNVPAGFDGAVGSFTMTMSASPTNVAVGDPITVHVQISGRGAIESLSLPEQPAWSSFKKYPSTAKADITDNLGIQGTKSFEQVITPQSADIRVLPQFQFSFFDPEARQYKTLSQPAIPLVVRPVGTAPAPTLPMAAVRDQTAPPTPRDIVHIKPRLGVLAQAQPLLITQPWFVLLQTLPVLAWLGALGWRRRQEAWARNPRLRRRRAVQQVLREGLPKLKLLAAENNSEQFFTTLFHLLQEIIGERLDMAASAITEAVVDEQLRPRGAPEPLLSALHSLFQRCNVAKYAPVKSSQELAGVASEFEAAVSQLQSLDLP